MSSIHEMPFVRITIPFIIGIAIGDYCDLSLNFYSFSFGISLAFLFLFNQYINHRYLKQNYYSISIIALIFSGASYLKAVDNLSQTNNIPTYKNYFYEGTIASVKQNGDKYNCDFFIKKYYNKESTFFQKFLVKLYISDLDTILQNGDQLLIESKLFPISKNKSPNTFDYKNYLRHKNIHYQMNSSSQNIIDRKEGSGLWYLPTKLNNHAQDILRKHTCCNDNAGIAIGMITGNKNDIPRDLLETYANVGTMHLLAVSGLHVGIIAGFIFWILSFVMNPRTNFYTIVLTIVAIWAFVIFTGAKSSTVRAGIMFSLLFISKLGNRLYNPFNIIACSAFIILILNPHALFHLGFQLSYLAVISIIFFYPRINNLVDYRKGNFVVRKTWNLAALSLAANILILPLSVLYFNQLSLSFVLANVFAVPLATVIVVGGFMIIALELIMPSLLSAFAGLYYFSITGMNWVLRAIEQIPNLLIENIHLDTDQILIIYFGLLLSMATFAKNKISFLKYPLLCFLCFIVYSNTQSNNQINVAKFTIYDLYGKTVVDFVKGSNAYFYTEDSLSAKSIDYNIKPNRNALGVKLINDISEVESFHNQDISKNKSLLIFSNKLFFTPQSKKELLNIPKEVNYLIINHTYGVKELNIAAHTKVVLRNDKYLNRWNPNIPEEQIIRISKQGAFTQTLGDV